MSKPLLDGASSVSDVIKKFCDSYGRNPTYEEFHDVCVQSGNTSDEIEEFVELAKEAEIVVYDKKSHKLSNSHKWDNKSC